MFNVCMGCGTYNAAKVITPDPETEPLFLAYAVCPECGYKHLFRRLPLFIVCGASGTGKTAICESLIHSARGYIPLEGDILWCSAFDKPDDNYRDFFEIWLRMAKNIGQSGRPVVLFSAGAGVPENVQNCVEWRYFSSVHRLALACDNATLEKRLKLRPNWRNSGSDAFITGQQELNRWYREISPTLDISITVLDTSRDTLEHTVSRVNEWITRHIPANL